jgi:hypothetical protein
MEENARDVCGDLTELRLALVVDDKDGKLRALRVPLGLGQSRELAFDVLLELGEGVSTAMSQ